MTLDEMAEAATNAPHLYLEVPMTRARARKVGRSFRMAGAGSPLGSLCVIRDGADVGRPEVDYVAVGAFRSAEVLAWLKRT